MKKHLFLFTVLGLTFVSLSAQVVGTKFPEMSTKQLDGKSITLPNGVSDKYTLVGLAYSKKSEKSLVTWFQPVYDKFIPKETKSNNVFGSFGYDVNVYFIPMFTGVNTAAEKTARKKALKKIDPILHPHILFYKGKLKPYKEALDFEKRDTPYFFVLDNEGKIVYATTGAFTEAKMDAVEEAIE